MFKDCKFIKPKGAQSLQVKIDKYGFIFLEANCLMLYNCLVCLIWVYVKWSHVWRFQRNSADIICREQTHYRRLPYKDIFKMLIRWQTSITKNDLKLILPKFRMTPIDNYVIGKQAVITIYPKQNNMLQQECQITGTYTGCHL